MHTFILLKLVHGIGGLAFLIGLLFLLAWAFKTLTPAQMKKWGIGLLVGGLVLCVLTFAAHGSMGGKGMKMRVKMGHEMMDHDMDDDDMMDMSMDDMSAMLEGKTGDEFDKAFIEGMIPHHQGAIDMANAAKTSAKHAEIKKMADEIIAAQQREIDMMRSWQEAWGY